MIAIEMRWTLFGTTKAETKVPTTVGLDKLLYMFLDRGIDKFKANPSALPFPQSSIQNHAFVTRYC